MTVYEAVHEINRRLGVPVDTVEATMRECDSRVPGSLKRARQVVIIPGCEEAYMIVLQIVGLPGLGRDLASFGDAILSNLTDRPMEIAIKAPPIIKGTPNQGFSE